MGSRKYKLKSRYGLTLEEYDSILERQGGVCGISGEPFGDGSRKPHVDHNHITGEVRGIVQARFNSLLGFADDNPQYLMMAAGYLSRSQLIHDYKQHKLAKAKSAPPSGKARLIK